VLVPRLLQAGITDKAGYLSVVIAQAAVLLDLRRRSGVDGAKVRSDDNIWDGWVGEGVSKAKRRQAPARNNILDLSDAALAVEVLYCGGRLGLISKEYESNIVGLLTCLLALSSWGIWNTSVPSGKQHQRP